MNNTNPSKNLIRSCLLSLAICAPMVLNACTNATSSAGTVSHFTEGVITDVEYITLDQDYYNTQKSAAVGAIVGAGAGQVIGGDSKATLIGAGIGAIIAGAGAAIADRTSDGARLTVNTNQGMLLVDQPFSCYYRPGTKIRMIQHPNEGVQVQVYYNGTYRTAQKGSPKDCPL